MATFSKTEKHTTIFFSLMMIMMTCKETKSRSVKDIYIFSMLGRELFFDHHPQSVRERV